MKKNGGLKKESHFQKKGSSYLILIFIVAITVFLIGGLFLGVAFAEKNNRTGEPPSISGAGYGDLSCPEGIAPEEAGLCLDQYLKSKKSDSPLIGQGSAYVRAGIANGINPAFMLAIAGQESTFGVAYKKLENYKNYNIQNMKCAAARKIEPGLPCKKYPNRAGEWGVYSSWEHSISSWAKYLSEEYFTKGLTTIKTIQEKYCPTWDGDCPQWTPSVTKLFNEIGSKCPALRATTKVGNISGGVIIDPGHGEGGEDGCDRGYLGDGTENTECGNNFIIAKKVKEKLEAKSIKTALTKSSTQENPSKSSRVETANSSGAGLFVSLHSNAGGGNGPWGIIHCSGVGVPNNGHADYAEDSSGCSRPGPYYAQSKKISHAIVESIKSNFGFSRATYKQTGELAVLNGLNMPSVLIEMFFHDSSSDLNKYRGKEDLMAESIANAIANSMSK